MIDQKQSGKSGQEDEYSPDERIWRPVFPPGDPNNAHRIPSETIRGLKKEHLGLTPSDITLLRDNFSLTTWILIGACLQSIFLSFFPFRYACLPAIVILSWRTMSVFLQTVGVCENPNMKDVILGIFSVHHPTDLGKLEGEPSQKPMIVYHLNTRCNHPLGMFAPGFKEVADMFTNMMVELEKEPDKYRYRISTPWIGRGGDRATSQELLTVFYFDTIEGVLRFAHSPVHRIAWEWWNANMSKYDYISMSHEMYEAKEEASETVYINFHRSGLSGQNVKLEDGSYIAPLVDASEGQYKTTKGRLNMVDHGKGNDKYGHPGYKHARLYCPAMRG